MDEEATEYLRGAGHEAIFQEDGDDFLFFHAYSATTGTPQLQISTMIWEDGWPRVVLLP